MSDAAFARAFERGDIANGGFRHASHLRLALAYLEESPSVDEAVARMASALRTFAAAHGHPEKYHHTITVFWMRMVATLLDKDLPFTYYSRERLSSEAARTGWIEPDLRTFDGLTTRSANPSCDPSDRPVSR
jgi:hypothetical protein